MIKILFKLLVLIKFIVYTFINFPILIVFQMLRPNIVFEQSNSCARNEFKTERLQENHEDKKICKTLQTMIQFHTFRRNCFILFAVATTFVQRIHIE